MKAKSTDTNPSVYLRLLTIADADISYQWRNNPRIWKYTGSKPDKLITPEIEREWLAKVIERENEKRFAICLAENDRYIGNIFFTDITEKEAQLHIFIGEMSCWGSGRAVEAMNQIVSFGFKVLHLEMIYGLVNVKNDAALQMAYAVGFINTGEVPEEQKDMTLTKMVLTRAKYEQEHPQ